MTEASFELHPQLANDCVIVGDLPLSQVLLMNDSNYPWLILVPRRAATTEAYQLSTADQQTLWQEVIATGEALMKHYSGYKLNIGALGNMVPQLHVHVIVRQQGDAAWPGPVWGKVPAEAYGDAELAALRIQLAELLGTN